MKMCFCKAFEEPPFQAYPFSRLAAQLRDAYAARRNQMEDIQKWLGHSQLATTEKIYAHFEEEQHIASAEIIAKTLSFTNL